MMMARLWWLTGLLVVALAAGVVAQAQVYERQGDPAGHDNPGYIAQGSGVEQPGPVQKLGRGAYNMLLFWTEVPNQAQKTLKGNWGSAQGSKVNAIQKTVGEGMVRGVYHSGKRLMYGGYEVLTFWRPNPGGAGYESMVQPAYPTLDPPLRTAR